MTNVLVVNHGRFCRDLNGTLTIYLQQDVNRRHETYATSGDIVDTYFLNDHGGIKRTQGRVHAMQLVRLVLRHRTRVLVVTTRRHASRGQHSKNIVRYILIQCDL